MALGRNKDGKNTDGKAKDDDRAVDAAADDVDLAPGRRALVGTGIAVAIPHGMVGLVHPRSGLAARAGLSIVNAPGTIDAGYRGEIKVCLINLDPDQPRRPDRPADRAARRTAGPCRGRLLRGGWNRGHQPRLRGTRILGRAREPVRRGWMAARRSDGTTAMAGF